MILTDIIKYGIENGESFALINQKLADNGANFRLVHKDKIEDSKDPNAIVDGGKSWTNAEMTEGFRMPGNEVYSPEDLEV